MGKRGQMPPTHSPYFKKKREKIMEITKEKLTEIRKREREIGELNGKLDFLVKQLETCPKEPTTDELQKALWRQKHDTKSLLKTCVDDVKGALELMEEQDVDPATPEGYLEWTARNLVKKLLKMELAD